MSAPSSRTGLGSAEAPEPSGLRPSDAIPRAAWTPGPWGVEHFGGSIYVGPLRVGEGRSGFEDILYATDCKDYTVRAVARELAKAHLIAAAPEMYEALATCLEARKLIAEGGDYESIPDFEEWLERATTALAKARGEQ